MAQKTTRNWRPIQGLRKHADVKKLKCYFCDGIYATQSQKMNHIKTIHKEVWKACVCKICEKTFSRPDQQRLHTKNIHEGVWRLKCDYPDCLFGAEKKRQLENHTIKHSVDTV